MDANGATTSSAAGGGSNSKSSAKKNSRKPKYSRFTQQELPACKPVLTPGLVVEIVDRYDDSCVPPNYSNDKLKFIQTADTNKSCVRIFYVKSRSDQQLRSKSGEKDISDCSPEDKTKNGPIVPCGLVAWSLFNDTYGFSLDSKTIRVNKHDIAWKSDKDHKFGDDVYPKNFQTGGLIGGAKLNSSLPLSEQEALMVWMRTAALPTFRKLYGKIEEDLPANKKIQVVIQNNYNTYSFGGKKKLVLSTTSWMGGKNDFLGIAYIVVGGLCLFLAVFFILLYVIKPR
ncbi:hypothetical protein V6N12_063492 [Hibiscus sabdariffa]|uniref:ALA-interacting subunit n=1 Tax=Hibiscus sabdariffa TaxID=183260 RepID=A0ABR2FC23_9ROSI